MTNFTLSVQGKAVASGSLELGRRQLYQVKHDYELAGGADFRPRPAEVFRLEPQHYVKLDEKLQRFWFGLIRAELGDIASEAQLIEAWRYLTDTHRAFTNGQGPDILRDYITGERMDLELPGISSLVSGGHCLAGVEDGNELIVETIDPNAIQGISRATHPHLIHYATVSTLDKLADGTYKVTKFTVTKMMGRHAPVPLLANREVRFPLSRLKKLAIGAPIPSPYNP